MSVLTEEREFLGILAAIVFSFGFLYHLITPAVFLITAVTGITAAAMGLVPLYLAGSSTISFRLAFFALFLVFVVPLGDAAIHLDWTLFSPISMILLFALAFVFFYYSIFFFSAGLFARQPARVEM